MIKSESTKAHQIEQIARAGFGRVIDSRNGGDELRMYEDSHKPGRVLLGEVELEGDRYQVSASGVFALVDNITKGVCWCCRLDRLVNVALKEGLE